MYRRNDADCTGSDSMPEKEKYIKMTERKQCLSRDASNTVTEPTSSNVIKPHNSTNLDLVSSVLDFEAVEAASDS